MKPFRSLSAVFIAFLLLTSFSTSNTTAAYVGKWKGEDKGDIGYITFTQDGYIRPIQ